MNENVTDSDIFINTYIKKQEDFTVKLMRERLELETKLQLVQTALIEKINEKNNTDELLKQSVNGVQALTIERDNLKKELDSITEKTEAFRNKCEQLTNSLVEEQNKTRELSRVKNDYDTLKNNYDLVKNSHEILQSKLDELQAEKIVKKKRLDKENIN
jgi:predicted RNase H-like nuclease (RuvC/YqgF family)